MANITVYALPRCLLLLTGLSLFSVAVTRRNRRSETTMFGLLCLWSSLTAFDIVPNLFFKGDTGRIERIERAIHTLYVFAPWMGILFIHSVARYRNRGVTVAGFALSAVISLSTFSDYYIYGLRESPWGYIPRAGIMLQVFFAFALLTMMYGIFMLSRRNKSAVNENERVKLRLLVFSIVLFFQMTLGSLPVMHGIDFYPVGNFVFIPLILMAWGIYRYEWIPGKS
ncbi:MAG: hypothetical protein EPN93_18590 [Spirochaetes bacterium]|nr:MAG: hypothetical protein EPN93_18590 [Spirochaetota bacterium]